MAEVVLVPLIGAYALSLAEGVVIHVLEGVIKTIAEVVAVSPIEPTVVVIDDCKFEVAMAEKPLSFAIPNVVKVPRLIVYAGVEQQLEPLGPPPAQQNVVPEH